MQDPKIGQKLDEASLQHRQGIDMNSLADWYKHPLESVFPSPVPKHRQQNALFGRNGSMPDEERYLYNELGSQDLMQVSEMGSSEIGSHVNTNPLLLA